MINDLVIINLKHGGSCVAHDISYRFWRPVQVPRRLPVEPWRSATVPAETPTPVPSHLAPTNAATCSRFAQKRHDQCSWKPCNNYKQYQHLSNILVHEPNIPKTRKTLINPYHHCAELLAMRRFALRQLLGEPLDFCIVDGTQGADIRQSALVVVRQFLHLPREKGEQWKTVEIVVEIDGMVD